MTVTCHSLRDLIVAAFQSRIAVRTSGSACVVTLPFATPDGRRVTVYLEPAGENHVMVHDNYATSAELFVQGVHLTEAKRQQVAKAAAAYGVAFGGERLEWLVSEEHVVDAMWAIAQASAMAMYPILDHAPRVELAPVISYVRDALINHWQPQHSSVRAIETGVLVQGLHDRHKFDFVAIDNVEQHVAIKVLPPSVGSHWQATRYGFAVLDIDRARVPEAKWPRLAVVSRPKDWKSEDLDLVRSLSAEVITIEEESAATLLETVPAAVDRVLARTQTAA